MRRIRARLSASEQARLGQQLGQDVTEMETSMRIAYLLPLHDTRREQAVIRRRMAAIEWRMRMLTALGEGPGHYALGRGYLALHEHEAAVKQLEAAYGAGYAGPQVAEALGQALGGVYRKSVDEAQRIADKDRRQKQIEEAERQFLEPALRYLKESHGSSTVSRAYIEGLIALYAKQYDEARRKAKQAFDESPSLYEAKKLEGDAHYAEGREAHAKTDYKRAQNSYKLAVDALQIAADIARSDAAIHDALAELWIQFMDTEGRSGILPRASLSEALAALDRSLTASPERSGPFGKKAFAHFRMGYFQTRLHEDPSANLDRGLSAANEAIRLDPNNTAAFEYSSSLHFIRAVYERTVGRDPRPSLALQAESLQEALRAIPSSAWSWAHLGVIHLEHAYYELPRGLDPRRAVERCIEMSERSHIIQA